MKPGKIFVVGGYGNVGRTVATLLGTKFPGLVIAGRRNINKAELLSCIGNIIEDGIEFEIAKKLTMPCKAKQ